MIYERQSYVSGSMCDCKLRLSILAADGTEITACKIKWSEE